MVERIVHVMPEFNKSRHKHREVPINDYLFDILDRMRIREYDKEFYLFGTPVPYGAKFKFPQNLRPHKYKVKRKTLSDLWKKLVKDELGIDKTFYSGKKLSANHKIEDGMSKEALAALFGHSSTTMTDIYITTAQRKIHKKEILQHSRKL